jgi:hypothetical protein
MRHGPHNRHLTLTLTLFLSLSMLPPLAAEAARKGSKPAAAAVKKQAKQKNAGTGRAKKAGKRQAAAGDKKGVAKKPAPPPPPNLLAGAWGGTDRTPQLGNRTLRSEVLVAALRLIGMKDSFDEDTFLRHVLYVTALARKDEFPRDTWSRELMRRLSGRGTINRDRPAQRGDIAFYSLDPAAGASPKAGKVLAGVVDSVDKGRVSSIAPLGASVARIGPGQALVKCEKPARPPKPKKGRKVQPARKAPPCRASELLIGTADIDAVARVL